jgi:hypothetical protein
VKGAVAAGVAASVPGKELLHNVFASRAVRVSIDISNPGQAQHHNDAENKQGPE